MLCESRLVRRSCVPCSLNSQSVAHNLISHHKPKHTQRDTLEWYIFINASKLDAVAVRVASHQHKPAKRALRRVQHAHAPIHAAPRRARVNSLIYEASVVRALTCVFVLFLSFVRRTREICALKQARAPNQNHTLKCSEHRALILWPTARPHEKKPNARTADDEHCSQPETAGTHFIIPTAIVVRQPDTTHKCRVHRARSNTV